MDPLYLVDGSGYIFRAFYAVSPLNNSQGLPTNALLGFTRMLIKLIREKGVKYLAVVFDTGQPTFRHQMYDQYKANRAECPAELIPQMPYFRKIVQALGINCLEQAGYEADDIIASIATKVATEGGDVVVVSGDKDLLQLVGPHVSVFDAMKDKTYLREDVKEKLGVWPEQVIDYLALTGDSSDNVPGVKGIGPKTAEQLLAHFGSLAALSERLAEVQSLAGLRGAKSVAAKLESSVEQLSLSRQLVALKADVDHFPGLTALEQFAYHNPLSNHLANPQGISLVDLFSELEFQSLLKDVRSLQQAETAVSAKAEQDVYARKNYQQILPENFPEFVERLAKVSEFAFDTETDSLNSLTCRLVGISISWASNEAYFLRVAQVDISAGIGLSELIEALGPIFANPEIKKYGFNLKFDINVLESHGFCVEGVAGDPMLAVHLLNPDRRVPGLKSLAESSLHEQMRTYEEVLEGADSIYAVEPERLSRYACHDADSTWQLAHIAEEKLKSTPRGEVLLKVYREVEVPLVPVLSRMEQRGIKLDLEYLEKLSVEFSAELLQLEAKIWALAGEEFNLNSPKQVSQILFEKLALPTQGVKKNQSAYSTDAAVLSLLAPNHEIAGSLLEYRELFKLNSTYVEALRRLVSPKTARVHTSFNQASTATGRLSSTEPNLQNIPIRNSRGRRLRNAFIAENGNQLLSVDYSQIELRVLAHMSEDAAFIEAFKQGEDIHERTARELFGSSDLMTAEERKELRRVAKTINFGIVYGMSAFRLSNELGVSRKQAQQYIDTYFGRYPGVQRYFSKLRAEIESRGYVETLLGRRRLALEVDSSGRDSGYTERSLINAPLQGTAAEVIKVAMIRLEKVLEAYGQRARMLLQVHDELVFEVSEPELEQVREIIREIMEGAVALSVPLKVDMRYGRSWGEVV